MQHASESEYDGIAYADLPIAAIDWSLRAEHIRRRSARKGNPNEVNVEPEWATEAATDPRRVVGDSGSGSGVSVRVVGWSQSASRVLVVILVPKDHPPTGEWWGATAWAADPTEKHLYQAAKGLT